MIVALPMPAKYAIWKVPVPTYRRPWVVIRPDLTVVGYFRTWSQARNAYVGDVAHQRLEAAL